MEYPEIWTRGLSKEDRADVEHILKNSEKTLDIVRNLVYNIYIESTSVKDSDFDKPGWPLRAARDQGKVIAYEKLLKLLDLNGDDRPLHKTKKKALTDDH